MSETTADPADHDEIENDEPEDPFVTAVAGVLGALVVVALGLFLIVKLLLASTAGGMSTGDVEDEVLRGVPSHWVQTSTSGTDPDSCIDGCSTQVTLELKTPDLTRAQACTQLRHWLVDQGWAYYHDTHPVDPYDRDALRCEFFKDYTGEHHGDYSLDASLPRPGRLVLEVDKSAGS